MDQKINVDLSKCETVSCECGGDIFQEIVVIKRIKSLMIGSPKDVDHPVKMLVCAGCGLPHSSVKAYYDALVGPKTQVDA